ncbi:MAG: hypothetical protein Q7J85_03015 [Bacillota bacterium]|nr:hypothetical protein [Bacillota bacterium]
MKWNLELIRKEIAVMVPSSHSDGGEATMLITVKGEKYLDRRSTGWILKRLAHFHNIDLSAVKKNYGPILGRKRFIPIPLSEKLIYVPLTLKTNTIPVDEKLGYISLVEVLGFERGSEHNNLILKNGIELFCCNTLKTIEARYRESLLIQKIIQSEHSYEKYTKCPAGGSASVAESNCDREEIARFTAAFLYYWNSKRN